MTEARTLPTDGVITAVRTSLAVNLNRGKWRVVWLGVLISGWIAPVSHASAALCDPKPIEQVPSAPPHSPSGSEFAARVRNLDGSLRDAEIREQLLAGNFPQFLRHLVPVTLRAPGSLRSLTICVLPDYLAVGNDRDFVYVPMGLRAALDVARRFGFELPTPKVVDAIYDNAQVRLAPQPLPAGNQMRGTPYLVRHNEMIRLQRAAMSGVPGMLTAGHKKDLVLTARLWEMPGRVAIYGWHRGVNSPIQPLSTVHGAGYADYSHGIRLVSTTVYVDGIERNLTDVLADPMLANLLSKEGPLPRLAARLDLLMTSLRP